MLRGTVPHRLLDRQLSGNLSGDLKLSFGSGHARRLAEITAAKQPLTAGSPEAVHRQQADSTHIRHPSPIEADIGPPTVDV